MIWICVGIIAGVAIIPVALLAWAARYSEGW